MLRHVIQPPIQRFMGRSREVSVVRNKKLLIGGSLFAALLTLNLAIPAAHAGPGVDEVDSIIKSAESNEARAKVDNMAEHMDLSAGKVVEYFKTQKDEGRLDTETTSLWNEMLSGIDASGKPNATEADFESADLAAETIGAYLKIAGSAVAQNLE